jgi:hypothetical protein
MLPHIGAQRLSYLYLSQIPYTGLDLGPIGTVVYWIVLLGGTLVLAYLIFFYMAPFVNAKIRDFGVRVSEVLNTPKFVPAGPVPHVAETQREVTVAPVALAQETQDVPRGYSSYDGFKSFAHNGALSIEDLVKGLAREHTPAHTAPALVEPVQKAVEPIEPIAVGPRNVEPIISDEPMIEAIEMVVVPADIRGFAAAIIEGDRRAVFAGLRQNVRGGGVPERLVSSIVTLLDDVYRSRVDGTSCDGATARLTARLDTPTLEKLITALTTAIDSSYTDNVTGAKLALTRALAVLGA